MVGGRENGKEGSFFEGYEEKWWRLVGLLRWAEGKSGC
jgi:hypothetical protein